MLTPQLQLPIHDELVVDLFAGGGGMSTAIERAIGRAPDIAINHDDDALSMHRINHPQTRHFVADVFEVCPRGATQGRSVGLLHLSPDCTHHSQAAGGQPRDRKIRALSWVGVRWAGQARPRIITLENVKQIRQWGPLVAKRCKSTGRVIKRCGAVALPGERVPVQEQYLVPDPRRSGRTWRRFLRTLQGMGYAVEHRILCAADYGAPTTRERLFLVARRDGLPIQWPAPTHGKKPGHGQRRWRAAAECIDWNIPCPSIFGRPKPLAEATLRRIARGVMRYVIESGDPFIVPIANWSRDGSASVREPLKTVTANPKGGAFALVSPTLVQAAHGEGSGATKRRGSGAHDILDPLGTVHAGGGSFALATAFLAQHNNHRGTEPNAGRDLREPMPTIVSAGTQGIVACRIACEPEDRALRVAAFLTTYYGNGGEADPRDPMATITTRDRLALVTVTIAGTPYLIVDIGLRMLQPRELYAAQGFPADYIIDRGADGRRLTKTAQVRMVGNSVSPPPAVALVRANWIAGQAGRVAA